MKCRILHETGTRLRARLCVVRMTLREANAFGYSLRAVPGIVSVSVFDRICDAVIFHTGASGTLLPRFRLRKARRADLFR